MGQVSFTRSSELQVDAGVFLSHFTLDQVNAELHPLVRMTAPDEWSGRPIVEWPANQPLFTSWILLFGVLPIDRHAFCLRSVSPAEGFDEDSSSTMNRYWRHQRRVTPIEGGCRVTDRVEYESRLPLWGSLLKPVYELVFRHRHRNLGKAYVKPPRGKTS
jgi:hypothetical protein